MNQNKFNAFTSHYLQELNNSGIIGDSLKYTALQIPLVNCMAKLCSRYNPEFEQENVVNYFSALFQQLLPQLDEKIGKQFEAYSYELAENYKIMPFLLNSEEMIGKRKFNEAAIIADLAEKTSKYVSDMGDFTLDPNEYARFLKDFFAENILSVDLNFSFDDPFLPEHLRKYWNEAFSYVQAIYRTNIFQPEFEAARWISNFMPPFFVMYLRYLQDTFNEISAKDVDYLINCFNATIVPEPLRADLSKKMKELAGVYTEAMHRLLPLTKGSHDHAFAIYHLQMFGIEPTPQPMTDICEVIQGKTRSYYMLEANLVAEKEKIISYIKQYMAQFKQIGNLYKLSVDKARTFELSLALFSAKYVVHHTVPENWNQQYPDRSYMTEFFIQKLIAEFFDDKEYQSVAYGFYCKLCELNRLDPQFYMQAFLTTMYQVVKDYDKSLKKCKEVYDQSVFFNQRFDFVME